MDLTNTPYSGVVRNASTELSPPQTLCDIMKQWAIRYATYGWHIVQVWGLKPSPEGLICCCTKSSDCPSPGKHPVETGWTKKATCNLDIVKRWRWENRNIGIVTGNISDLYVIDQDVKNPNKNGVENLAQWESENCELFPKFIVETGGGGYHYYFPYPLELDTSGFSSTPLEGVDIRADNQFVVAPPSLHYKGGNYVWGV